MKNRSNWNVVGMDFAWVRVVSTSKFLINSFKPDSQNDTKAMCCVASACIDAHRNATEMQE